MSRPRDIFELDERMSALLEHADAREAANRARTLLTQLELVDPREGPTLDHILDTYTDVIRRSEGTTTE